jgi:hypothetical protein
VTTGGVRARCGRWHWPRREVLESRIARAGGLTDVSQSIAGIVPDANDEAINIANSIDPIGTAAAVHIHAEGVP